jgi:anti-sigma regulatory factor (Ser/Thr protein kinase)
VNPKTLLLEYQLPSRLSEIAILAVAVEQALQQWPALVFSINLCLEELITNIIEHGLQGTKDSSIQVQIFDCATYLEIRLKDDAPAFDPFSAVPSPDLNLALADRPVGGLGVYLVKQLMDELKASYEGDGNLIIMRKDFNK